jgi:hypothetical protein
MRRTLMSLATACSVLAGVERVTAR